MVHICFFENRVRDLEDSKYYPVHDCCSSIKWLRFQLLYLLHYGFRAVGSYHCTFFVRKEKSYPGSSKKKISLIG